jgi:hypothetical protein
MAIVAIEEYAVDLSEESLERPFQRGLSHSEAMAVAERMQRMGKTARVMHLVGAKSYEVDRYPPR